MKTKAVLQQLFDLLEEYAPAWYTEEHRDRVAAALDYPEKPALRLIKSSPSGQDASADTAEQASSPASSDAVRRKLLKSEAGVYLQ
jgi:hypothetical protein